MCAAWWVILAPDTCSWLDSAKGEAAMAARFGGGRRSGYVWRVVLSVVAAVVRFVWTTFGGLRRPSTLTEYARRQGYRIIEPVGRGGMGVVYQAYQPRLGRYVAVKELRELSVAEP